MVHKSEYRVVEVATTSLSLVVARSYGSAVRRSYTDVSVRLLLVLFVPTWITIVANLWSRALCRLEGAPCRVPLAEITASDAEASDV
jgi:hypothetical protein